jgi:hypothetical protein
MKDYKDMFEMTQIVALVFATVVSIALAYQPTPVFNVYASESSPYDSGYNHGCDDAGRSESDKYINQPEKGPSFHTGEFMDGYYAGLNACSGEDNNSGCTGECAENDKDHDGYIDCAGECAENCHDGGYRDGQK